MAELEIMYEGELWFSDLKDTYGEYREYKESEEE